MSEASGPFCETAHGVAAWPFGAEAYRDVRPDRLPDGGRWPQVCVFVVANQDDQALKATRTSVIRQDYPESRCEVVRDVAAVGPAIARIDPPADYLLVLRSGDLLAPGALAAACLEPSVSGTDVVIGLRVLFDHGVHGLDVIDDAGQFESDEGDAPFTGGEILIAREAFERAGGIDPRDDRPMVDLWRRLTKSGVTFSRIGRPILLQRDDSGAERPAPAGAAMSIASLTGLGYGGGAGIAHRRLAEALALAGHKVSHWTLGRESPAAAAEWTDRFPATEGAICEADHDLVLAGNLHGVTRSVGILGRLSEHVPVASVLHDLFLLTGRCAHPKDCPVIGIGCDARCPSPTEYPQLAPRRIAAAFAEKRRVLGKAKAPLLLANSEWTAGRARELAPAGAPIARIGLAFPTGIFRPRNRRMLRRRLGLPEDDILILFSAVIADAPEKGVDDLIATMARVARPGIGFVALGRLDDPTMFGLPGLHAPGPIGDEEHLAEWYGACDIYLTASRLETLGQTPIEAGLCGTPTVAYRATGLTSAVFDGVTGLLVDPRPGALAEGLERLIADEPLRHRLGASARILLESRFSHAAAAYSFHQAITGWGAIPRIGARARMRFAPAMLGQFAFARERSRGATGLVGAPSPAIVRWLRRTKQAAFGRGMPIWMRRAAYALALARRRPSLLAPRR